MGLGLHGQPGAGAARPVAKEQQLDPVPAKDPTSMVGGTHAWDGAETTKIVRLGSAQVVEIKISQFALVLSLSVRPILPNHLPAGLRFRWRHL